MDTGLHHAKRPVTAEWLIAVGVIGAVAAATVGFLGATGDPYRHPGLSGPRCFP